MTVIRGVFLMLVLVAWAPAKAASSTHERTVELTFESDKAYADPFNDIDVDVTFTKDGQSWRVPTFWRGGNRWTVRFAPPTPGEYAYRVESSDKNNSELNSQKGIVKISAYAGQNDLFRHGMIRVSADRRYFEYADGKPFFWLGDTWWAGLSTRLSWDDFKTLTADRKAKGFTVVQLIAGLVPFEEVGPSDPGFCNEGGCVWDSDYARINPNYFDYADRRIQHLFDAGITPVIYGAWGNVLEHAGIERIKKHWRYLIGRYGAYPIVWVGAGEVCNPPEGERPTADWDSGGWDEVMRYIRATDPYHHPISVEECVPPGDTHLRDESLTDFDALQPAHSGWDSVAFAVAQLNTHYARTTVIKPLVIAEIGYENLGDQHYADFQRAAFWIPMLNRAAGRTYGADGVWESYSADKPLHRWKWSFTTWQEGINFPGSKQVGLGARLLQQYPWWRFEPHPEWVTPRGTTMLEPHSEINIRNVPDKWKAHNGNFYAPYAAGIPAQVRFVYIPCFSLHCATTYVQPTVLALEQGVAYQAYYWEPSLGIKVDLGVVKRPAPASIILEDKFEKARRSRWADVVGKGNAVDGKLTTQGDLLTVINDVKEADLVASVDAWSDADVGIILRYQDARNYVAAVYSAKNRTIAVRDHKNGEDGSLLGITAVPSLGSTVRLSVEVRGKVAAASITDGQAAYSTPVVDVGNTSIGSAGLISGQSSQAFDNFQLRKSPRLVENERLERKLYDGDGNFRGEMAGGNTPERENLGLSSWDDYGKSKHILLDAYRPEKLPSSGDWLLVLDARRDSAEHAR